MPCLAATTFSVLTRLPGDARLAPADAARLLKVSVEGSCFMMAPTLTRAPVFGVH